MHKRILVLFILFVSFFATAQDLSGVRSQYPSAVESSEVTSKLNKELSKINSSSPQVLIAYKGAVLTLMAKFAKGRKNKKKFFKDGVSLIESAVKAEPSNIEIHYIRMSVQENSPRFLGYHKNIDEDKQFVLKNFKAISSKNLKTTIKAFAISSKNFGETEKQSF